ncbi:ATP-binding protein [Streptomyces sp. NPDC055078]
MQRDRRAYQSRGFPLEGGPGVVSRCRELTRRILDEWYDLSGPDGRVLADDVLLLVSEVVANACRHGGAPSELRFDHGPGRLWVQVSDTSPVRPRPHGPHRAARTSGHGLYLLERLSDGWGWLPHGTGKTVWFVMRVPG